MFKKKKLLTVAAPEPSFTDPSPTKRSQLCLPCFQSSILHTILALTTLTLTLSLGWKFYHNFCLLRYSAQCPAHGKWPVLRRKWTRPIPCDTDKADYSPQVRKHSCVPQLYHHLSGTSQGFSILSHTMGRIIHMRLLCGLKTCVLQC